MGAIALGSALDAGTWDKAKPKDYKETELSKALKALEAVNKKSVGMPQALPAIKVKEIDDCIKTLTQTRDELKAMIEALDKVAGAAGKVSADLKKQLKDKKDDDKKAYERAEIVAAGMQQSASNRAREFR